MYFMEASPWIAAKDAPRAGPVLYALEGCCGRRVLTARVSLKHGGIRRTVGNAV